MEPIEVAAVPHPMTCLTIRHETLYSYERPVGFSPHRLLVRPRDSHATRIVEASPIPGHRRFE